MSANTETGLFATGNALAASGDYAGALACYEGVLAARPTDPMVHTNVGAALARLGRLDAAEAAYRRAIAIDPGLHVAINNLGNLLRDLGRLKEAHDAFRQAIRLSPQKGAYYRALVQSGALPPGDPHILAMEGLLQPGAPLDAEDRISLHFALGQALADIGEPQRAFSQFLTGNALQRQRVRYDEAANLGVLRRIGASFTAALIQARRGCGDPSAAPVFIVGMPRSGSTLVEQILASHPGVFGAGERNAFPAALARLVMDHPAEPSTIATFPPEQIAQLGADYLQRLRGTATGAADSLRITDKYLDNFIYLGLIHIALPNARFIHVRRNPVDTCLSCFTKLFSGVPYSYDLGELGRYYRAYQALMAHWTEVLPEGVMIDVRYEDLVADVVGQTQRMLAHCGLPWDEACLAFHQNPRVVCTESAAQVRQPIYRSSLVRWRPSKEMLQPLLDGLEPPFGPVSNVRETA